MKSYYIYKCVSGCLGAESSGYRLPDRYSNKNRANKAIRIHRKNNTSKNIIFWLDFEWRK